MTRVCRWHKWFVWCDGSKTMMNSSRVGDLLFKMVICVVVLLIFINAMCNCTIYLFKSINFLIFQWRGRALQCVQTTNRSKIHYSLLETMQIHSCQPREVPARVRKCRNIDIQSIQYMLFLLIPNCFMSITDFLLMITNERIFIRKNHWTLILV